MNQHLLAGLTRLRLMALLLTLAFGISFADAAIESDDINAAILIEGSVVPKWKNDTELPWYIAGDEGNQYIHTPDRESGMTSYATTLEFTYSSAYPTELTFTWIQCYWDYYNENLTVTVDGDSSWYIRDGNWNAINPIMLAPGDHTVTFTSIAGNVNYSNPQNYWGGVKGLRIWECKELETACLKEGSLPLTFVNDPDNIWITEDGYIRSPIDLKENATSKISTTFTIDTPSLFSFEHKEGSNGQYWDGSTYKYYTIIDVTIDGVQYKSSFCSTNWSYQSLVLYPGTHTVEFEHHSRYSNKDYYAWIRNVQLDQTWLDARYENPGKLGSTILQELGYHDRRNLQDAELVKISGPMNSDDWNTVLQLKGIKAIDFTEAIITSIPASAFENLSYLSTVMLPEGITSIGNKAFVNTNFHCITIPASVESIGREVWSSTPLQYIDFAENSKLKTIGYYAFGRTNLLEFDMPDSVTEFGRRENYWYENNYDESDLFNGCRGLKRVHLSENIKTIPTSIFYDCSSLEEINLPQGIKTIERYAFYNTKISFIKIPTGVTKIGGSAFSECKNLKEAHLSSNCWSMNSTFYNCHNLEKVVIPCATPPSISSDPFSGVTKGNVRLEVPDFAYESFKADSYWYRFTNTVASDEASINDYWAIRGNLTLNNAHLMQGTPSIEMYTNSTLLIDEGTEQNFNKIVYNTNESYPANVLSRSNDLKANSLVSYFYVEQKDKWYFFAPVTDVKMSEISYPATDSWVIRHYDGARRASEDAKSGNWINVPADGMLHRGQGYIIQAKEPGWLYMPAATDTDIENFLGSKEVSMELADNPCETEANAGWNFVANPYPTYYDIYYIDMQAPITVWDGSTYRAYSLNDGDRGDDTFVLRPMQPFFVQKTAADLAATMPLVGRQINTAINRTRAPRKTAVDENRHKLNLEFLRGDAEEADDYTRIVINEAAPMKYDATRDASKFMSMDSEVAQFYSIGDGNHPMAINERPYDNGIVALGVYIPAAGETYRIAATRADRQAWLFDAETGIEQDLTEGDYSFMASKTGTDNVRFSIRFAPVASAVDGVEASKTEVKGVDGFICVNAAAEAEVSVFTADGRVIAAVTMGDAQLQIPAVAGVYVVKVNGRSYKTIVK